MAWWAGEQSAQDTVSTNVGALENGVTFASGQVGQAFAFNGVNQVVQVADSPDLNPTNELTLEAWVYIEAFSSNDGVTVFGKDDSGSQRQYMLGMGNVLGNWVFRAHLMVEGGFVYFNGSTSLQLHTWYHVAMAYDGTALKLYVNGALDGSLPTTGPIVVTRQPLLIGGSVPGPWYFNGRVDELSLYKRGLSASEVQAIYSAGAGGKCLAASPPVIYAQPTNQTVVAGHSATFEVSAGGTLPLSYQWAFNGTDIDDATTSSLTLVNVQTNQAGAYSVLITNANGSILSSNAVLNVEPAPVCVPALPGLLAWWRGEGDAKDAASANDGSLLNGAAFAPGLVGQAFSFDGGSSVVSIPDAPALNPTEAITLEAWVRFDHFPSTDVALLGKDNPYGARQYLIGIGNASGNWVFRAHLGAAGGFQVFNGSTHLQTNNWYHVAMTYNGSALSLFVNGSLDSSLAVSGPISPTTDPFIIGGYGQGPWTFNGLIDEPTLYGRALSTDEIQSIYNAQAGGKCPSSTPPFIAAQPASQSIIVDNTATFLVGVGGTPPLSYQWNYNGAAIPGATNASLVLTNVQWGQAGSYSVQVTNALGSASSSNALLVVSFPPAAVQVVSTSAAADGSVTVPVLLLANGNENALGFSINFSTSLLSLAGVSLGSGAEGGTLLINTNLIGNGHLGVALSLSSGSVFSPGTQEVARVSFVAAPAIGARSAILTFGDQPTLRQLSDTQANPLSVGFASGTVLIPAANFEGDVSPRPNGDKTISITDWVQAGRYAARLDYPTNAAEYQRADTAPRSTLGDGIITVADWVQAGRYAAGLDPLTRVGGPTNDVGPMDRSSGAKFSQREVGARPKGLDPRQLRVAHAFLAPGQSGVIPVFLEAQGNENALGFSLAFDPAAMVYAAATVGSGAAGATMNVNASQADSGKLAIVLSLPIGNTFSAGTKEVVELTFTPPPLALGSYDIAFTDQPVIRQVVDPAAEPLATDFINGVASIDPLPTLTISQSKQSLQLSWPLWATNYSLQAVDTLSGTANWTNLPVNIVLTNGTAATTVPIGATTQFYRLKK